MRRTNIPSRNVGSEYMEAKALQAAFDFSFPCLDTCRVLNKGNSASAISDDSFLLKPQPAILSRQAFSAIPNSCGNTGLGAGETSDGNINGNSICGESF
jgi:hypothetical protein